MPYDRIERLSASAIAVIGGLYVVALALGMADRPVLFREFR